MKKLFIAAGCVGITALLAGCGPNSALNYTNVGAGLGAIGGGVVGSTIGHGTGKTVATIAGTLIGGALGGLIGHSMDEVDRMKMAQTLQATPNNQTVQWSNKAGNQYTLTPTATYHTTSGQLCRNFTSHAIINGKPENVTGTACRQPNGDWKIVN